jgi:predicted RNA-binding protein YlxR (DUF448 family)
VEPVTGTPRAPIRTCIGCRQACAAGELLRLVLVDGRPVPDPERRRPGRGASIHPRESCIESAIKRGGFGRAFRGPVAVGAPSELIQAVKAAWASSRAAQRQTRVGTNS